MSARQLVGGIVLIAVSSCTLQNGEHIGLAPSPVIVPTSFSPHWLQTDYRGSRILDLFFVDRDNGWSVTNDTLLYTTDGGDSWNEAAAPKLEKLRSVSFRTPEEGYAVGGDFNPEEVFLQRMLKSVDKGRTWFEVTPTPPPPRHFLFNRIRWATKEVGYVSCSRALITRDGGATWGLCNVVDGYISDILLVGELKGWAVQDTRLFSSENGGKEWTLRADLSRLLKWEDRESITQITSYGKDVVWLAGDRGTLLKSVDEGKQWGIVTRFPSNYKVKDMSFTSKDRGWAVLYDSKPNKSKILRTDDGGIHWAQEYVVNGELVRLFFINDRHGWAAGDALMRFER